MKRPKNRRLKTTEKVLIICEGETEECYVKKLLKDNNLMTANISIESSAGGGYTSIKNYINRNKSLYSIILVVCDLDRAAEKQVEKSNLKALINFLERENIKNNIFLNSPNIEVWIAASISVTMEDLQRLRYSKGNKVCRFINEHNGSFELACLKFANADLYFEKREFRKGTYKEEAINSPHSNLVYFLDYMRKLIKL